MYEESKWTNSLQRQFENSGIFSKVTELEVYLEGTSQK